MHANEHVLVRAATFGNGTVALAEGENHVGSKLFTPIPAPVGARVEMVEGWR